MAEEKSLAARLRNVRRRERRVRGIQPKNFNSSDKSSLSSRARCQGAISPFIPLASKRISMQNSGSIFFFFFFSSRWNSFSAGFSLARSGISFVLGSEKCIDSVEIIQKRCMVNRPSEQRKKKRPPENINGKNPILLNRRSCWWVEKERKRLRDLFRVIFKLLSAPCSNFPLSVRLGAHSVLSSARLFLFGWRHFSS